jgi:hypothetical protein
MYSHLSHFVNKVFLSTVSKVFLSESTKYLHNRPLFTLSYLSVVDFITKMLSVVRFLFTTPD